MTSNIASAAHVCHINRQDAISNKGFQMRYGALIALLLSLSTTVSAATTAKPIFTGAYECHGFDPYINKYYSGTAIIKQQNAVYSIVMTYDTGETSRAIGGQYNETLLSVAFQDTKDLKKVGLEQYALQDDKKTIEGYWVYLGEDKLGKETCEKITSPH
ncbi:MAG: hypothetical protein ACYC0J_07500 [Gammaproteobacteria bacterium]